MMKNKIINPKTVAAGVPKKLTGRMPAPSSATVAHGAVSGSSVPVRRVPEGIHPKVKGLAG
ncbi:MAG: hypothetical protein JST93_36740 [Acidobacteria bacterium]|nr:hypothetical protein [Acidobacteriota bacterium]